MHTLLLETIDAAALTVLEEQSTITLADASATALDNQALAGDLVAALDEQVLADVDAILTRGRGRVTSELMARCPALRAIGRCGVGLDNIDVDAASAAGIAVINAPGSATATTAEHTVMLILAVVRRLFPQVAAVKGDNWDIRDAVSTDECAGKTLGVVGLGAIGSRVIELCAALGMEVIAYNRTGPDNLPRSTRLLTLTELLAEADIVTLHVALTPETRGLIGQAELAAMRRDAFLVNTARGALVDTDALLEALDSGQLAGYAADGVDPEPPGRGDRLIHHPNTLITPHSAALTEATYRRMCLRTVHNVLGYLADSEYEADSVFNADRLPAARRR